MSCLIRGSLIRVQRAVRSLVLVGWTLGLVAAVGAAESTELPACPDPVIIQSQEPAGYFVFSTGRGIPIWFSADLHAWKPVGRVFDRGMPEWASKAIPRSRWIWAPDISYFGGKYHLYYAVSTFGSQRSVIGLAVNETLDPEHPDYQWEDRGLVIESSPGACDFNAIDPALFVDHDGIPYLLWGSYWTGLKGTRIDPATGKPAEDPPAIVPLAGRAPGTDPPAIEAPFLVHRDGFYYLFVSWDFCCAGVDSTYKIMVGRSQSVLGPYVDDQGRAMVDGHAKLVLATSDRWRGPGHNSVLQTDRGDWLVYSCYDAKRQRRRGDRVLNIRPISWEAGWPVAGELLELRLAETGDTQ